jgi:hypothetical protein
MVFPRKDAETYALVRKELGDERYLKLARQGQWGSYGFLGAALGASVVGYDDVARLLPIWAIGFVSAFFFLRTTIIFNRTHRALRNRGDS